MAYLYLLLICASLLANRSANIATINTNIFHKKNDIAYFVLVVLLICFAGLRGSFNDSYAYINAFRRLTPFERIDWSIGSNPFFVVYQSIIKKYITDSPNAFLFISSAITVGIYLRFLKKHSCNLGYSVFVAISLGVYGFTMAAIKQTLATALALIGTECYFRKKRIWSLALLCCAVLFHPYVIVFVAVPFLKEDIWNRKSVLIILATFLAGSSFTALMEQVLKITDAIGENYSISSFGSGTGVNILRVFVYCVVPALSFVYRKKIRKSNDNFLFCAVNLSLLASCFTILSTFGGAVAIARMARYLDIFQCIVLPYIIYRCIDEVNFKKLLTFASVVCFLVYYYFYYKNYIGYGWFADYFNHISIIDFVKGL